MRTENSRNNGERVYPKPLASESIRDGAKKYHLDILKSDRGLYVRVAEVLSNGKRNFIVIDLDFAEDFLDAFDGLLEGFADTNPLPE